MSILKKLIVIASSITILAMLSACAPTTLKAPCPNYGQYCPKTPINSWDYSRSV